MGSLLHTVPSTLTTCQLSLTRWSLSETWGGALIVLIIHTSASAACWLKRSRRLGLANVLDQLSNITVFPEKPGLFSLAIT